MIELLTKQTEACSSSLAKRFAAIKKVCVTLETHYRCLKQYNCNS